MKADDDALIHPLKIPQLNRTVHDLLGTQEPDLYSGNIDCVINYIHYPECKLYTEIRCYRSASDETSQSKQCE